MDIEKKVKEDLLRTFPKEAVPEDLKNFKHYIDVVLDEETKQHLGTITFITESIWEKTGLKRHLVITSIISHSKNFIKNNLERYKKICKDNNIDRLEISTTKKAVGRLMMGLNFKEYKTIYTCEV